MLEAVLFDWGHTLYDFVYDDELLDAGWEAGLAAIGRENPPDAAALADRFREAYLPRVLAPDTLDEVEYPALIRELLGEFGVEATGDEVDRFLEAEHEAWLPARRMGDGTHALLDSLRSRGLRLGLVSNAWDPPWLMHRDLEQMGVAERLDVAVFSSEVGRRKPDRLIFDTALERLGVAPGRALFVGDRRYEDVRGASELGMKTVLALWFRADEDDRGVEPDFEAFTQMDVLNVVRRLLGET
ncbi:MAG TPA: HAD family hydrolase [Gaiellaceae bacterium]